MSEKENGTNSSDSGEKINREKLKRLTKKLDNLKATEIVRLLNNLKTSFYIVSTNFRRMVKAFNFYQENDNLWNLKNRPKLNQFQTEFIRLFHNYIASYYSFYQHTIRIRDHIDREDLNAKYEKKLNETEIEKISNFLRRFRVYTQHYQLPPLVAKLEGKIPDRENGEEVINKKLVFDKEKLLEWEDWHEARSFVENFEEDVDFFKVTKEYQQKIKKFTKWFVQAVEEKFPEKFEEFESVLSKLKEINRENLDDDVLEAWGLKSEK